ncbi:condensation domain-containing protein [Mycobacterium bourgelatii]|uniref:condensation domain-containing protein n=1 Tax=Mycobacterium bourgelatii TaxID=1273442 RepID=UPI001F0829A2|nr:condensation domain-containing protein [Mycobacterium bourgelatii]
MTTWAPTPGSKAKALKAPAVDAPPSSMQAGHIINFVDFRERGLDYSRLVMGSWEMPGKCDIRTMTHVINAHLRRHETYRSWFEYQDPKHIIRHEIQNPRDIQFVPVHHGELTQPEWRDLVLATPSPLEWDCFRLGVIQHENHCTLFAIVDHLHCDPALITGLYVEILANYQSLVAGKPPVTLAATASHAEFCKREKAYADSMTLDSPEIRKWVAFAEANGGNGPEFPLPLGDQTIPCGGDMMVIPLLSPEQTARFEDDCIASGARFSGGLFACAALAHYELTGEEIYRGLTPIDKRRTPEEYMTMGWFTGVIPFEATVDPNSFVETARSIQASFDENIALAQVPYDRVLELAPWLNKYGPPILHDELHGRRPAATFRSGRHRTHRIKCNRLQRRQKPGIPLHVGNPPLRRSLAADLIPEQPHRPRIRNPLRRSHQIRIHPRSRRRVHSTSSPRNSIRK